ncbi:MAPEG family protein [Thalassospira sp. UBA1131]|uniref:MAPEG family protein n=1 Tax=Thalassospira sp. UBA1131 TaxID=1947672 RepID=UPI0025DE7E0B|nr:MAPEG family protein [Thalassospira sp. UBA1131]
MTYELTILVLNAFLCLAFPWAYNYAYAKQPGVGGKRLMGNRDSLPERTGMAARGARAHQNHLENLVPFAIIVLTAHAISISNTVTVACAAIFLAARIAHASFYLAGITRVSGINGIRSIAYFVSLFSMLVYASQLFLA